MNDVVLNSSQVRGILGIGRSRLGDLVQEGTIKVHEKKRGHNYFLRSGIGKYLAEKTQSVAPEPVKKPSKEELTQKANERFIDLTLKRFGAHALSDKYVPVVRWSAERQAAKSPGTPVLFISDVHYGEVVDSDEVLKVNRFDRDICVRRLKHTFETAVTLLKSNLAAPDYPGIVLLLGGDMINGALHEDSAATDQCPPLVQAIEVARVIADGVAFLSQEFPKVSIYGVSGNHGRLTRKPWAKWYGKTNLDWLSYVLIKDYVRDLANVTVEAPPVRDLTIGIANRRYRLTHGDQFRGGDGIIGPLGPVTRGDVRKRFSASQMPNNNANYDTLVVGHFHQLLMLPRLIMNGSVKGYDEFALGMNLPYEPPQQALWTVHPKHGQTWYMPILCEGGK